MTTLKQTRLAPEGYPPRAEVGDVHDWMDPLYEPADYTWAKLLDSDKPLWADERYVPFLDMLDRPATTRGGKKAKIRACCIYDFRAGRFLNPAGKTGITGRGVLGKWGANWAADVIVTKEVDGELYVLLCTKVTQDGDALCFPAGMVEADEKVPIAMRRELCEEAVENSPAVDFLFSEGEVGTIYTGHVDDYRNTDHAWMVTQATHFHASPKVADRLVLNVKDKEEISKSGWYKADDVGAMYASHKDWLKKVIEWHRTKKLRCDEPSVSDAYSVPVGCKRPRA
jgi:ADP-ribose pyrophosphatase